MPRKSKQTESFIPSATSGKQANNSAIPDKIKSIQIIDHDKSAQ